MFKPNRSFFAGVAVGALLVFLPMFWVISLTRMLREFDARMITADIAELSTAYMREYTQNGTWPPPNRDILYAATSGFMGSEEHDGRRTDTFQYQARGPLIKFELSEGKLPYISVKIIWEKEK